MERGQMSSAMARAFMQFVRQLVVALLLTTALASLWALVGGEDFVHAFHVSLYVFGGIAVFLGALGVGGMSPSSGLVGADGMAPGLKAGTWVPPDGTAVNSTAILLVTGAVLIGIGIAV